VKKVLLIAAMLMVPTVPAQATVLEESDQVFPVQDMPPGALLAPPCEGDCFITPNPQGKNLYPHCEETTLGQVMAEYLYCGYVDPEWVMAQGYGIVQAL
jgi:hypothetical protein